MYHETDKSPDTENDPFVFETSKKFGLYWIPIPDVNPSLSSLAMLANAYFNRFPEKLPSEIKGKQYFFYFIHISCIPRCVPYVTSDFI